VSSFQIALKFGISKICSIALSQYLDSACAAGAEAPGRAEPDNSEKIAHIKGKRRRMSSGRQLHPSISRAMTRKISAFTSRSQSKA
jgi:hypothetical protein